MPRPARNKTHIPESAIKDGQAHRAPPPGSLGPAGAIAEAGGVEKRDGACCRPGHERHWTISGLNDVANKLRSIRCSIGHRCDMVPLVLLEMAMQTAASDISGHAENAEQAIVGNRQRHESAEQAAEDALLRWRQRQALAAIDALQEQIKALQAENRKLRRERRKR